MNKSKKLIGMALSVCLCASMLAGCGSDNKTETPKNNSKTESSEAKKTMVIGIIAVIAVVLAGVGIKNVATSIPDYEKPLRYEIDGINKKHIKKPF